MTEDDKGRTNQDDTAPWTEAADRKAPLTADEAEAMGIGGNPMLGQESERHAPDNDNDEPLTQGDMTLLTRTD